MQVLLDAAVLQRWSSIDVMSGTDVRLGIFDELVCQRLQKGYQIVLLDKAMLHAAILPTENTGVIESCEKECYMSVNRIYHRLTLNGYEIKVKQWRPQQQQSDASTTSSSSRHVSYQYQFKVDCSLLCCCCCCMFVYCC